MVLKINGKRMSISAVRTARRGVPAPGNIMPKRYRIGVIGTGQRARSFVPQLHSGMPRAELFGVCDTDSDRLQQFVASEKLQGVEAFTDVDAFFAREDLDAVIATVPDFVHRDIAVRAMRAGKPLYMEKPIAHTLDDAYTMVEVQRRTGSLVYLGFNLRAAPAYGMLRQIVASGILGQIIHIDCTEQLHIDHIASYMRRFHRKTAHTGGLLNAKCSHDLDIMNWLVGHQHRVTRISSFGGCNVFLPSKQPATHCRLCPLDVYRACPYKAPGSDELRSGRIKSGKMSDLYPGDLCVFNDDKDITDNQTLIMEWDNGVRGSFNLQGFQHAGNRMSRIWGEKGVVDLDGLREPHIRVTLSDTGDTQSYHFQPRPGAHGGADALMVDRFIDAIECGDAGDSGLPEGLAATLVAIKADESRRTGRTVDLTRQMYERPLAEAVR